jgi:hypothetical protein
MLVKLQQMRSPALAFLYTSCPTELSPGRLRQNNKHVAAIVA